MFTKTTNTKKCVVARKNSYQEISRYHIIKHVYMIRCDMFHHVRVKEKFNELIIDK